VEKKWGEKIIKKKKGYNIFQEKIFIENNNVKRGRKEKTHLL
jgi:hypothetical protein